VRGAGGSAAGAAMPPPTLVELPRAQARAAASLQRFFAYSKPESVDAARRLLHLCKAVDLVNEPLYAGPALARALWRYEALWLPLLVAVDEGFRGRSVGHSPAFGRAVEEIRRKNEARGGLGLRRAECVPPLDVAWVWHCHRLSPKVYEEDVRALAEGGGRAPRWTAATRTRSCSATGRTRRASGCGGCGRAASRTSRSCRRT
jgi:hypothetical protein